MAQKKAGNMKFVLSALTLCLVAQQSLYSGAHASMITGIAPEHGSNGNIYNIDPSVLNGDIGFRLYEEFQLDKGDIANLIFKYGEKNVEKFVNLVDNTININGIVNTMRDGNFYNGQAIFVSPNGMVVGASGVLNVGSLTVLTPDQNKFDQFKTDYEIRHDLADLYSQGTGKVTIDGKVIARDAVDIRAAAVNINNSIMSGVGNNTDVLTSHNQADILFNSLVNTDNMKAGNSFASDSGSIKITSYSGNDGVKLAEGSTLKNFGKGNIEITSQGSQGIVADGDIKNPDGNVILTTTKGSIDIAGDVQNRNGDISADSANGIYLAQSGSLKNENGNIKLKNKGTKGINIKGSVENSDGNILMDNSGSEGIILDGTPISNVNGNIDILNTGAGGTEINGTVTNTNGNSTYTNKSGALTVNGKVANEGGNLKFDNTGTGIAINTGAEVSNSGGNLEMSNTGIDGILVDKNAKVSNVTGDTIVTNNGEGGITVNGEITNTDGNSTYTNHSGALSVNGSISNTNGDLVAYNKGQGGILINGTSSNKGGDSTYTNEAGAILVDGSISNTNGDMLVDNSGEGGMTINGAASNITGNSSYINKNGKLVVNGKVTNEGGNLKFDNTGTGIAINTGAEVSNSGGNLEMSNTGVDGILVDKNAKVSNTTTGNTIVTNSGEGGITINGEVTNADGNSTYTNNAGALTVNGTISNTDGALTAYNKGQGGILINGTSSNKGGDSTYTNEAGGITVDGQIINENGSLTVTNSGDKGITINGSSTNTNGNSTYTNTSGAILVDGNISNTNGDMLVDNSGEGGMTINGAASNIEGNSIYINKAGMQIVNGKVTNEGGNLKFDNRGLGIQINDGAEISNKDGNLEVANTGINGIYAANGSAISNENGNTLMTNSGEGGMTLDGVITNTKGNAEFNNAAGAVNINGTISNNNKLLAIRNTGTGLNINENALVDSEGTLLIDNSGADGMNISGKVKNYGHTDIINSNGDLNINTTGEIEHISAENDSINIINSGNKLYIDGSVNSENGKMTISNTGAGGLHIDKNGKITDVRVDDENNPVEHTPEININNDSIASMDIDGTINSYNDRYSITNSGKGALNINETANITGVTTGESTITNYGDGGIKIAGNITSGDPQTGDSHGTAGLTIKNDNAVSGIHVTETGNIDSKNIDHTYIFNNGEKGIVVDGKISQNYVNKTPNSLKIVNSGQGGVNITSTGRINNTSSTYIENSGKEGIKVAGLINTNGLNVKNKDSNVVIGDNTENDKYITSTGDVNIDVNNGSILNYGVNKTLINIQNASALNMNAVDGTIGLDDGNCGAACIGVGPDSRDFTKSINVTSDGAITATTSQNALTDDLVINIAGKNSDLNIDHVKADGKVLLTTADFDKDGKGYSILNASTDPPKANVEGKGIALIASDKIGEADNKLTFNQTEGKFNMEGYDLDKLTYQPNAQYGMDVLAINDINIKGQDDKYDTNVCTMISREGSINAEFSGNTYIREVTADKDLNLVTRGAEFVIDNLGTVPYTPEDYFGPNGNNAPENVNIKALDINPNTRVDDAGLVDGIHSHWADSHLIIKNAKVDDNAKIVLTGDNVYAGGYRFYMGRDRNEDGKTYWVYDDRTEMTDMSGNDPTIRVNAVREDDVTSIGRQEEERNYYTGGSVQEDKPWYGDDDDDDDDDDHLIVPEPGDDDDDDDGPVDPGDDDDDDDGPVDPGDDDDDDGPVDPGDDDDDDGPVDPGDDDDDDGPVDPGDDDDDDGPVDPGDDDDDDGPVDPGDDDDDDGPVDPGDDDDDDGPVGPGDDDDDGPDVPPGPGDDDDDLPANMDDAKRTWKKVVADDINIIDKRQYIRFRVDHNPNPVVFESVPTVSSLVDISRGGVALTHNKALKVGDVIPVHIKYGDLNIDADVKIVTASDVRAGGEFVDLDQSTANRLLYLNLMLEEDQKLTLGSNNQI